MDVVVIIKTTRTRFVLKVPFDHSVPGIAQRIWSRIDKLHTRVVCSRRANRHGRSWPFLSTTPGSSG